MCLISALARNAEQYRSLAQRGVQTFHERYESGNYSDIYRDADAALRSNLKEEDLVRVLQNVQQKLGKIQRSTERSWLGKALVGQGFVVTMEYETQFTGGEASEHFIWRFREGRAVLAGYKSTSPALAAK